MDTLQQIRQTLESEMPDFIQTWDQCMHSDNRLLQEVLNHVSSRKGKMMRPILTMLAAKLCGSVNQDTLYSAVALDLMHTATLIHDDVVDESDERRGLTSVNKIYDNKIAVLVGDFILALAIENVSKVQNDRFSGVIAETTQELASGELLQLKSVHNQEISEDVYFRIIYQKTASLFAACAKSGALSATTDEEVVNRLSEFGKTIGLCFQIRDDIFDYYESAEIGKPTGNDMKEGKLTLPVIFALQSVNDSEMLRIAKAVKNLSASESEIAQLIEFAKQNGGIEYAEKRMFELADDAKALLSVFPDSDIKSALILYVDYVARRTL